MKIKIGVFGSAVNVEIAVQKAEILGKVLGEYKEKIIVVTGAADGMPYKVASIASSAGCEVWGFSAATNLEAQKKIGKDQDYSIYSKLIYIPRDYEFVSDLQVCRKYRNVTSTATCDAGIIIAGRWGTMNEFTNLHDMGKVIGVLTGTGGIADEIESLKKKITKESKAKVIYEKSPKLLVDKIFQEIKRP